MNTFNMDVIAQELRIASRDAIFECNVGDLPHDILRQLIPHAIKQKLADSAASVPFAEYMASKPDGAPKPSRDQLADFVAANATSVTAAIHAAMGKAWDAMVAGKWQVREASGGTVSRWTDEQSLAIDMAKAALAKRFTDALAKGVKPIAANFVLIAPKVAAFFKVDGKRPTWDDKALMAFIDKQREAGTRDYMQEAREEIARRESADDVDLGLDDLLADL